MCFIAQFSTFFGKYSPGLLFSFTWRLRNCSFILKIAQFFALCKYASPSDDFQNLSLDMSRNQFGERIKNIRNIWKFFCFSRVTVNCYWKRVFEALDTDHIKIALVKFQRIFKPGIFGKRISTTITFIEPPGWTSREIACLQILNRKSFVCWQ